MPLEDDENGRAKCAFKMLQYMACAIPSVVTPIGLNRDLLAMGDIGIGASTTEEWVDALEQLYETGRRHGRWVPKAAGSRSSNSRDDDRQGPRRGLP